MIDSDDGVQTDNCLSTEQQTENETVWVQPKPASDGNSPGVEPMEEVYSSNENLANDEVKTREELSLIHI